MTDYLARIGAVPLLTAAAEEGLGKRIEATALWPSTPEILLHGMEES
ncbi:sigma-70 factor domain-containing protein [Nonomuraea sp. SYSU D8015]|nr:sigma-70 factor domain-containing protein [Nonomuraea sp. SYSU D8015]